MPLATTAPGPSIAPPVAFTRFALNGRQVPVPFELALANIPRASGARYELRGSLWVDGRMRWVGPATSVTAAPGRVGVGTLWLEPVQLTPAVVTRLRCGEREVSLERVDEARCHRSAAGVEPGWILDSAGAFGGARAVAAIAANPGMSRPQVMLLMVRGGCRRGPTPKAARWSGPAASRSADSTGSRSAR